MKNIFLVSLCIVVVVAIITVIYTRKEIETYGVTIICVDHVNYAIINDSVTVLYTIDGSIKTCEE